MTISLIVVLTLLVCIFNLISYVYIKVFLKRKYGEVKRLQDTQININAHIHNLYQLCRVTSLFNSHIYELKTARNILFLLKFYLYTIHSNERFFGTRTLGRAAAPSLPWLPISSLPFLVSLAIRH